MRLAWALALALLLPGFSQAAPLPVETLFQRPKYGDPVLSPSGRFLAVLTPVNGRRNAAIVDLDQRTAAGLTSFPDADVLRIEWQTDERLVLVIGDLQRASGEPPRRSGIVALDRDGGRPRLFGKRGGFAGTLQSFERPWSLSLVRTMPGSTDALVTVRDMDLHSLSLYRFDTVSGRKKLLSYESPGKVSRWVVDFDGLPRAAVVDDLKNDRSAWLVRRSAESPWRVVDDAKLGRLTSAPMEFSADGKTLYVDAHRDGDRAAIYEYDVDSGQWTGPVVRHPDRDIRAEFVVDRESRRLLGLRYEDDRPAAVWFDTESATMQRRVDAALPQTVNVLQQRGNRWVVVAWSDRNPGDVFLLDGGTMKMEKLFSYEPWIDPDAMAGVKWIRYPARDGLAIPAMLAVPAGGAARRVPLVVMIHGGPYEEATSWRFDAVVQFFVSRGYAVLRPQFRGTRGFGDRLHKAGLRKWGDAMQDDLADGVKWAVDRGIADAARVCFYGASYGGYAAIWGAIKNADLIKCAIAHAAPTSLEYLFDNAQTDMSQLAERSSLMADQIGDPSTDRAHFKRVSPLDNADRVQVPILLAYGGEDLRVPMVHGNDFRRALDKYGKPYEWVFYGDEAHGLSRDENVFDFYHRVERFLARYLGGTPP